MRPNGLQAPVTFRFGAIEVQPAARQLCIDGAPAALGARAFDLLVALIERRERTVAKQELFDVVWPRVVVEEGNLHVQMSALRKLLGPSVITTIPGRGYQFVAPLDLPPGVPSQRPGEATPADGTPPAAGRPHGRLDPLIGRDDDLNALTEQVQAHRLVTLVGAGGMGKTALAQVLAQGLRARWRDGVWWVDLAPLNDPAHLVQWVAQALRIRLPAQAARDAQADHLVAVVGPMSLLLVLDNCEHVVDAVGDLVERIVTQAPGVHVLATSQELLNVPGEILLKLSPLALPAADASLEDAAPCGAIQLFVARARAADARFVLSADNAQAVADICRRLDGLPLAIELAAARVRLLGVQALHDKLGERFRVLTGGARTALRRHQTLRAALDWSHDLLSPMEQRVFRRLGVFVGGFGLELAQPLLQDDGLEPPLDEWTLLDMLGALVDKSLLIADATEPPRYHLLETTRAYALEKLAAAGETDAWIARHARGVCACFERIEDTRYGEQGELSNVELVRRSGPELDNARAALDWAEAESGDLDLAVGLTAAMVPALWSLAISAEAANRLMRVCARLDDTVSPLRAARLRMRLAAMGPMGRVPMDVALDAADRAEHFYRSQGMPRGRWSALRFKAMTLVTKGDWRSAQALLPAVRCLEDPVWPGWRRSKRLDLEGWIHLAQGHYQEALALHEAQRLMLVGVGERANLIKCEVRLGHCLCLMERYDECITLAQAVIAREGPLPFGRMTTLWAQILAAQAFSGRIGDACATLLQALSDWRRDGNLIDTSATMAVVLAERGHWGDAARVGAASLAHEARGLVAWDPLYRRATARWQGLLATAGCRPEDLERWQREGQALDEAAIEAICLRDAAPRT